MTRQEILKLAAKIERSSASLFGERIALIREEAGDTYVLDGQETRIVTPDTHKAFNAPKRGTVIAVGSGVSLMEERFDIQPGDVISYVQPNAGEHQVTIDGEEHAMTMIHVLDVYWCWRPVTGVATKEYPKDKSSS
jgi:co-chaperonin GroES (HSP10)